MATAITATATGVIDAGAPLRNGKRNGSNGKPNKTKISCLDPGIGKKLLTKMKSNEMEKVDTQVFIYSFYD